MPVKGRFAPSPSGRMHLGNLFSFLLAWLSVRHEGGSLVLRVEDLDPVRCQPAHAWQHPRNTAAVSAFGEELGWVCTVHPAVCGKIDKKAAIVAAQLDMDAFAVPVGIRAYIGHIFFFIHDSLLIIL